MKLYVGNLPFTATEDEVRALFETHGTVRSVNVIRDRETGRPRGFGFVEMDDAGATGAVSALNGMELGGRNLMISEARPRSEGGRREGGRDGRRRF